MKIDPFDLENPRLPPELLQTRDGHTKPRCRGIINFLQPFVSSPVHPFRLGGKHLKQIGASIESRSNFPGLADSSMNYRFMLARVSQTIAAAACEEFSSAIEYRYAAPTIPTTSGDRTDKPGTTTAEVTFCPSNFDALFDAIPLAVLPMFRAEH